MRLRDLTRECPYHGVSNHELTQIFYDGLGPQDRYLLDAANGGTFMSKYEDDVMELIKTVAEIATITRLNHLEEVECQNLSTSNQQRRGCSLRESKK